MSRVADALRRANPDMPVATAFHENDHPWTGELGTEVSPAADVVFNPLVESRHGERTARGDQADRSEALRHLQCAVGDSPHIEPITSPCATFDVGIRHQLAGLVERVFLVGSAEAPRCVAFAGIGTDARAGSIAAAVGEILAQQTTASVCVVDADFMSPSVHDCFGVAKAPGLAEALESNALPVNARRRLRSNLWVIPSGESTARPVWAVIPRARMSQVVAAFDHVVIHLEPFTHTASGVISIVDGIVLVVAAESTRRDISRQLAATLKASGAVILGAVLTDRRDAIPEALYRRL